MLSSLCVLCHDWIIIVIQIYVFGRPRGQRHCTSERAARISLRRSRCLEMSWASEGGDRVMSSLKDLWQPQMDRKGVMNVLILGVIMGDYKFIHYTCAPHCSPLILMNPSMLQALAVLETVLVDGLSLHCMGERQEIDCDPDQYYAVDIRRQSLDPIGGERGFQPRLLKGYAQRTYSKGEDVAPANAFVRAHVPGDWEKWPTHKVKCNEEKPKQVFKRLHWSEWCWMWVSLKNSVHQNPVIYHYCPHWIIFLD